MLVYLKEKERRKERRREREEKKDKEKKTGLKNMEIMKLALGIDAIEEEEKKEKK